MALSLLDVSMGFNLTGTTDTMPTINSTDQHPAFENTSLCQESTACLSWSNIKEILTTIQYVTLPTFLFIGLFGNVMSILTMSSKRFSQMTSRMVIIALSLSDSVLLLTQPFNKLFVIQLFGSDFRAISDIGCKAFFMIFKTAKMTSSWFIIMLCFERYVAVVFPLKAKQILRKKYILICILVNYLLIGGYNSVWTFSSMIINGMCKPDVAPADTGQKFHNFLIIGVSVYSFIPTVILLILTPQIIYKISKHRGLRRQMSAHMSRATRKDEEMIRVSIMVLGVMIAYIVFVLPITILHVYASFKKVSAFDVNSLSFFMFREIAQILEQLNYAINFFFYVLCSRQFRKRVVEILCCGRRTPNGLNRIMAVGLNLSSSLRQTLSTSSTE